MSKQTTLDVNIRAETGKNGAKKVIAAGKIPSVIYGLGEQPLNISIDKISVQKEINSGGFLTRIFSLNIDGKKTLLYQGMFSLILYQTNRYILTF